MRLPILVVTCLFSSAVSVAYAEPPETIACIKLNRHKRFVCPFYPYLPYPLGSSTATADWLTPQST